MEVKDRNVKQSKEEDYHWVEKLFPSHFTFQDLLEGNSSGTKEAEISSRKLMVLNEPSDSIEAKRQIYVKVLREVQEKEKKIRSNLARRISRDEESRGDVENKGSCKMSHSHYSRKENGGEGCIWNEKDISKLREAFSELQRDRWRLMEQLRSLEEQLKTEKKERRRQEELLTECQEQLGCSRKEAARHALLVKALKMEVYLKDTQLQNLAKESQEKADEVDGLRLELRRTRDGYRQIKQESSDLAWQLEKVKEEQKLEVVRQVEEDRLEYQAATVRLQREVEKARAELRAERENHGRTLAALELLRRHYNNQ